MTWVSMISVLAPRWLVLTETTGSSMFGYSHCEARMETTPIKT